MTKKEPHLKKIPASALKEGMFLHELCGSWMEHPFWKSSFKLKAHDVERIIEAGIEEAWIDTSRGIDAPEGVGQEERASLEQVEKDMERIGAPSPSEPEASRAPTPIGEEIARAAVIVDEAKKAVKDLFGLARMGKALDEKVTGEIVEQISDSVMRNPGAIISVARIKNKDEYTYMHSVAVCALMVALARQMGLSEEQVRLAGLAGLLHDVGKIDMPDAVLNKPGALTDAEFNVMRSHPEAGWRMLKASGNVPETALEVCLRHHEKIDGSGYPGKLKGEEISMWARMGAVCDVYDAITSDRPYKRGWSPAESIRKMAEWKGHFDETIFQAFVKSVGIYPVGSLVRLRSDRLAVVIEQASASLLTPKVKICYDVKARAKLSPETMELSSGEDRIVGREEPAAWGLEEMTLRLWMGAVKGHGAS